MHGKSQLNRMNIYRLGQSDDTVIIPIMLNPSSKKLYFHVYSAENKKVDVFLFIVAAHKTNQQKTNSCLKKSKDSR